MAEQARSPRSHDDYQVAVLCALILEARMVRSVFDQEWDTPWPGFRKARGDNNTYTVGRIGAHNVVLVHMPRAGNIGAATSAAGLRSTFPAIELAMLAGICGTSPRASDTRREIILGDCIVSTAVIQYDSGRQYPGHFSRKTGIEESLGRPGHMIAGFLAKLQTSQTSNVITRRLVTHLRSLQKKEPGSFYPGKYLDHLYDSEYLHCHRESNSTCGKCIEEATTCTEDCTVLGCEDIHLIKRVRLTASTDAEANSDPQLHFGRYGSADTVLKSGVDRDQLANNDSIVAFEMEGAGLWEALPAIIVKSACDYADSHKNKRWQSYAAATAACSVKAILEQWTSSNESSKEQDLYDVKFSLEGIPIAKEFIDRPTEMQRIEAALLRTNRNKRRKIFVLRGMGGIGKTQLAVEFMRLHRDAFSAVIWLDGSSADTLKQSIVKFVKRIPPEQISNRSRAFADSGDGDIDTVIKEVIKWLELRYNDRWLLVFDNVDREHSLSNPDHRSYDINAYLPNTDHGSILITTRLVRLESLGTSQEVNRVNEETAQAILTSRYKPLSGDKDCKSLLEKLDGLPLAIAQVGSYLRHSGINIKTYLRLYEEEAERIEEALHHSELLDDYPDRSVWTTWNISYDVVRRKDPHTANLLVLWSFLDRTDLCYWMFQSAAYDQHTSALVLRKLGNIAHQESSFLAAMALLCSYSLIEGAEDSEGYSMHSVVHRWVYLYHGTKNRHDLGLLALLVIGYAVPEPSEQDAYRINQRLLPHASMCSARVIDSAEFTTLMQDNGVHCINLEDDDRGVEVDHSKINTTDMEDSLYAVYLFGQLYITLRKYETAEKMHKLVLELAKQVFGSNHRLIAFSMVELGYVLSRQRRFHEAEETCKLALETSERLLGMQHMFTLVAARRLGEVYIDQGRVEDAEAPLLRAEQGMKQRDDRISVYSSLYVLINLCDVYIAQGRLGKAEDILKQARERLKDGMVPIDKWPVRIVFNSAVLCGKQGDFEKAETLFRQVLSRDEEDSGPIHPDTLRTVDRLGWVYEHQGRLEDAEKMYMRALEGFREALHTGQPWTCAPVVNQMKYLGDLYAENRPEEAQKMYTEALVLCEDIPELADKHQKLVRRLKRLASKRELAERTSSPEPGPSSMKDVASRISIRRKVMRKFERLLMKNKR